MFKDRSEYPWLDYSKCGTRLQCYVVFLSEIKVGLPFFFFLRSIDVLSAPNLLLLCTIQVHHKLINCLQWYPSNSQSGDNQSGGVLEDGLDGSGQSGKRYWLASGSNEPQVQVHDLNSVLGKLRFAVKINS